VDPWSSARHLLDAGERRRYRSFDRPDAAAFFALRRAARRLVLSSYLDIPPDALRFTEGLHGKPAIASTQGELHFSASDTGWTGMIAVGRECPLGLDVEGVRAISDPRLAERILSPDEWQALKLAPTSERNILLLRAWTGKEAMVKGMGLGLDLSAFRQITLALSVPAGTWSSARLGPGLARRGPWQVCEARRDSGPFTGAVVTVAAPTPRAIRVFDAMSLLALHGLA
jgi:phosphopantetheinyl transferase